jgi:hypothetical protein
MTKAELHALVDSLPDASLEPAAVLLRRAHEPLLAQLDAADFDDEPYTDDDRQAVVDSRREPGVSWSVASAELNTD